MPCQLPADCLNEIFGHLGDERDDVTLRSCLLVDRLWCEVSVRILWTNIQIYNTLIGCLPNKSKESLFKNGITVSSKPPLFNYVVFIKNLSIFKIIDSIHRIHRILNQSFDNNQKIVIAQEMFKMLMNQTCLKTLDF